MKIDGNKVKKIRLSLGKSQEEFGQLFNPPAAKSAVCRWEKGHGARKGRLKKIAKLAGVPVESLCPDLLTEKQKNCPYCHHKKNIVNIPGLCVSIDPKVSNGNLTIKYDASNKDMTDNNIVIGDDDGYVFGGWNLTINCCPMCGRPLNEEEE